MLVVIHTPALDVLLIKRADFDAASGEFWQSVTGSKDFWQESFGQTARREVEEETGIVCHLPKSLEGRRAGGVGASHQRQPSRSLPPALTDWHLENIYDIYPRWQHRYAPGVQRNTEHLFSLQVPAGIEVRLNPKEHTQCHWLPWREAAEACYSPSNAEAILLLPKFATLKRGGR